MTRLLRIAALSLTALVCFSVIAVWLTLRASLPRRSGDAVLPGLSAAVALEFDTFGIARVRGDTQLDVLAAQGFVHAQDRFFQMDLTRRSASGELAALFGSVAIEFDTQRRVQQLRRRARAAVEALPARHRQQLESYTRGVNAGLADLGARPPEYLLLRQRPEQWLPEDSMLVVFALYTMLSNNDSYERHNGALREHLAPEAFDFFTLLTARDDRPLMARDSADVTGGHQPAEIPPIDSMTPLQMSYDPQIDIVRQPLAPQGSNNWAVVGGSAGAQALVANDPHLGIRVPNIFHRAELYWDTQHLRGVGIPGLPGIVIGENGFVAWGATVSYSDQADFVVINADSTNANRYLVPTGAEEYGIEQELIVVAGQSDPLEIDVRTTRWGPIVGEDYAGRPLALRATWLDSDGLDLSLLDIYAAGSTSAAIELLRNWRGPSLSWVAGDVAGSIGWTVNGPIPVRRNFDGITPEHWGSGNFGWRGVTQLPSSITAGSGSVYSANNRQLAIPWASDLSRLSLPPHRARAISQAIAEQRVTDEHSSLMLQLDTRVQAYDQLRDAVLASVAADDPDAALAAAREHIRQWNGHAGADSRAMPILDRYYDQLLEHLLGPALAHIREADPDFQYRWPLVDESMRRVLDERPAHFLPGDYTDWNEWLREILRRSLTTETGETNNAGWGSINRLDVSHPLGGIPLLSRLLAWPSPELPGNTFSLRVAKPDFGAVLRMNVRPASPEAGILQFAGGQSGHFLSPNYSDQLADWADGTPTAFLAGATQHNFTLQP